MKSSLSGTQKGRSAGPPVDDELALALTLDALDEVLDEVVVSADVVAPVIEPVVVGAPLVVPAPPDPVVAFVESSVQAPSAPTIAKTTSAGDRNDPMGEIRRNIRGS